MSLKEFDDQAPTALRAARKFEGGYVDDGDVAAALESGDRYG